MKLTNAYCHERDNDFCSKWRWCMCKQFNPKTSRQSYHPAGQQNGLEQILRCVVGAISHVRMSGRAHFGNIGGWFVVCGFAGY